MAGHTNPRTGIAVARLIEGLSHSGVRPNTDFVVANNPVFQYMIYIMVIVQNNYSRELAISYSKKTQVGVYYNIRQRPPFKLRDGQEKRIAWQT